MAKKRIIWSHKAKIKLYEIMEFYAERNHSKVYSIKLYKKFTKNLNLLLKHPDLGIKTNEIGVRGLIVPDYILFYEVIGNDIVVHTLWPSKQHPADLIVK